MTEISEFTELKNDAACDTLGMKAEDFPKFEITCPDCAKVADFGEDGYYHCTNCDKKFVTERFILD